MNPTLRHRNEATPFRTLDGSRVREIAHPTNSACRAQSLAEATVSPGATTKAHFHPRSEEIYYVLSGRGEVALETGDESATTCIHACTPGAAIIIGPGVPHQVRNTGDEPLVFLCCCSPPYSHGDTVLCDPVFASAST
jgi:mannose-6-phosphate isomerase-like protein (cupin superfamily)